MASTDMNAIRADEELDNLHSLYADQWDWEAVITKEETVVAFTSTVVCTYGAVFRTEFLACEHYPQLKPFLPKEIRFFIPVEDLLDMYPDLSPKEHKDAICKKYGTVLVEMARQIRAIARA